MKRVAHAGKREVETRLCGEISGSLPAIVSSFSNSDHQRLEPRARLHDFRWREGWPSLAHVYWRSILARSDRRHEGLPAPLLGSPCLKPWREAWATAASFSNVEMNSFRKRGSFCADRKTTTSVAREPASSACSTSQ